MKFKQGCTLVSPGPEPDEAGRRLLMGTMAARHCGLSAVLCYHNWSRSHNALSLTATSELTQSRTGNKWRRRKAFHCPQTVILQTSAHGLSADDRFALTRSHSYPLESYAPDSPDTFFRANANIQPSTSDSANTPPSPLTFAKPSRPSRQSVQLTAIPSLSQSTHNTQSSSPTSQSKPTALHHLKRHSISHPHAAHRPHSVSVSGPSPHFRRERERQLANTPREALIQLAIRREHDYSEAKATLTKALLQLENVRDKLAREQEARRLLEEEKRVQGVKTTKSIIDAQRDAMQAREETRVARVQVQNMQTELNRARDAVRHLEDEKDETDRALVRARTSARQFKEKAVLLQAREEGRQEGFEEGLRQGRDMHALAEAPTAALRREPTILVEEEEEREEPLPKLRKLPSARDGSHHGTSGGRRSNGAGASVQTPANPNSLEEETARASLRAIDERENLRVKMQLSDLGRKLDANEQRLKEGERERERLRVEREKLDAEKRGLEEERDRQARKVRELEREQEELRAREKERRRRDEEDHRRMEEEMNRELRELKRERSRLHREKEEGERRAREELERERERLKRLEEEQAARDQREKDRDTSAAIAAAAAAAATAAVGAATASTSDSDAPPLAPPPQQRLSYLAMPPPPMPNPIVMPQPPTSVSTSRAASAAGGAPSIGLLGAGPVPRTGSVGSRHARRRQSGDSSSSASTMPMDMLQFPSESERDRLRDRELSVIHEAEDGSTVRGASPIPAGPPGGPVPTWMTHPPVDHARAEMEAMRSATPRAGPNVEGWRSGIGNGPPSTGSSTYRANPYQQTPNPDFLAPNYPPSLSRRPSNASSGSDYNITIEPPSGPPSSIDNQEADRTGSFLSPNHAPISLPQIQPSQPRRHTPGSHGTPVLPVRPPIRSPYDFDTSGIPTAPNSPVQSAAVSGGMPIVLDGPPPPGFIPQMITDNRGVSTPLTGWTGLPGMGGPGMPGPTGPPVIPRSASRASTDSEPPIWNGPGERPLYGPKGNRLDIKKPGGPSGVLSSAGPSTSSVPIYGNPLNRNREQDQPPRPPTSTPTPDPSMPVTFPHSPSSSNRPVIPGAPGGPPSTFGQGFAGASWSTPHQRSGSLGGATPGMSTRDLPGAGPAGSSTITSRSGFGIYGPPAGVAGSSGTPRFSTTNVTGTPGGFGNYVPATLPNPSSPMMSIRTMPVSSPVSVPMPMPSMPPSSPMMTGAPVIPVIPGAGPGPGAMYGNPVTPHGHEDDDGFDEATLTNTKLNAMSSATSVSGAGGAPPGPSAAPTSGGSAGAGRGGKGKKGKKR